MKGARSHSLVLARAAWAMVAVSTLSIVVASFPLYLRQVMSLSHPSSFNALPRDPEGTRAAFQQLGLSVGLYATYDIALQVLSVLVFMTVATVIFWRRPDDPAALFVSFTLLLIGTTFPNSMNALKVYPEWWGVIDLLGTLGFGLFFILFYIFPNGRFAPRWTRPLAAVILALLLLPRFFSGSPVDPNTWHPALYFGFTLAVFGSMLFSQAQRYRRVSGPVERQQTKLVVFGLVASVVGVLTIGLPSDRLLSSGQVGAGTLLCEIAAQTGMNLSLIIVPLSFGIAILRYRLYDIDVVINRALVYGALTATLVGIYFGGVALLQWLLREWLNEQESQVAVVASTLAIAALFHPLRRTIQGVIDRRFYRRKYAAARTLQDFSTTLRDEVNLSRLTRELSAVVQETMQPAHFSVWLRDPGVDR